MKQHYVNQYSQVDIESALHNASSHQVIAMLMQGFLTSVNIAKSAIAASDFSTKNKQINKASAIIYGLLDGLDLKQGEVAENLFKLYNYINARLLEATTKNSQEILDEVAGLMREVKQGWDGIADKVE